MIQLAALDLTATAAAARGPRHSQWSSAKMCHVAERKTWAQRELVVLEAVLDVEEQLLSGERPRGGREPDTQSLVQQLEGRFDAYEVMFVIDRLVQAGYLTGEPLTSMQTRVPCWWQLALTEKSRVALGLWPEDVDPVGALVDALAQRERAEEDPEVKGVLRRWREDARGLPGHATKELLSLLLKAGPGLLS